MSSFALNAVVVVARASGLKSDFLGSDSIAGEKSRELSSSIGASSNEDEDNRGNTETEDESRTGLSASGSNRNPVPECNIVCISGLIKSTIILHTPQPARVHNSGDRVQRKTKEPKKRLAQKS